MTTHWVVSSSDTEPFEISGPKAKQTEKLTVGATDDHGQTGFNEDERQPGHHVKVSAKAVAPTPPPPESPIFAPLELKTDCISKVTLQSAGSTELHATDILHLFTEVFEAEQSTRSNSFNTSQAQINASIDDASGMTWHDAVVKCCSRLVADFSAFLQRLEASATPALDSAYIMTETNDAIKPALEALSAEMQMVSHELLSSLKGSFWPLLDRFKRTENQLTLVVVEVLLRVVCGRWSGVAFRCR